MLISYMKSILLLENQKSGGESRVSFPDALDWCLQTQQSFLDVLHGVLINWK